MHSRLSEVTVSEVKVPKSWEHVHDGRGGTRGPKVREHGVREWQSGVYDFLLFSYRAVLKDGAVSRLCGCR